MSNENGIIERDTRLERRVFREVEPLDSLQAELRSAAKLAAQGIESRPLHNKGESLDPGLSWQDWEELRTTVRSPTEIALALGRLESVCALIRKTLL